MRYLILTAALLTALPAACRADMTGNPDQRPSIQIGARYAWDKTSLYLTGVSSGNPAETAATNQNATRFFGALLIPAQRSLSILVVLDRFSQAAPSDYLYGSAYTRSFSTGATLSLKIYL